MGRIWALGIALALTPVVAIGQGTGITLGSLQHDTSLPVEVTSDNLSVENEAGVAIFDGNVIVIQGAMRLAAGNIRVSYGETGDGGRTEISEMIASGGVTFANGSDAAEASDAVYSPEAGTLVMTGDVVLTQGPSVISGERLTVDLGAGTGVMEGRVRTIFQSQN
ncbi:LptA/OstA family protein [Ovoidimarina sediminis]|uniref:LptA/OstA family protein n=1 Tax=Ovoidimarina sediminis TaxID=3079856 RepID=UPI002913EDC9|nr:LptA/OstA family protein [Rhodophyticola sp. MJ-SS7]MDU8942389.1 LptA/OstA family protein [Rhodophyticola sp. MJ-SS7]